jgi:hypothetical protein
MDLTKALSPERPSRWRIRLTAAVLTAVFGLADGGSVRAAFNPDPGAHKPPIPKAPRAPKIGGRAPLQTSPMPDPFFFVASPPLAQPPEDEPPDDNHAPEPATLVSGLIGSAVAGYYVIRRRRRDAEPVRDAAMQRP